MLFTCWKAGGLSTVTKTAYNISTTLTWKSLMENIVYLGSKYRVHVKSETNKICFGVQFVDKKLFTVTKEQL